MMKYYKIVGILFLALSFNVNAQSINKPLPKFIQFGIMSKNHQIFTKKYGVQVIYENCVLSDAATKRAKENNQKVAKILNKKYGTTWQKNLGFIPFGL